MKKSTEAVLKFISAVAFGLLLIIIVASSVVFFRCFHEIELVPEYTKYAVVHIQIYGVGTDTVSARLGLCDTSGKEFAVIDRSWNGNELKIDFASACFGKKQILFPYRIYPVNEDDYSFSYTQREGTRLSSYYMERNKCLLLGLPCTNRQKTAMYRLGVFALMQADKIQSKFSRIHTLDLSGCRAGESYYIITGSDGELSLTQM